MAQGFGTLTLDTSTNLSINNTKFVDNISLQETAGIGLYFITSVQLFNVNFERNKAQKEATMINGANINKIIIQHSNFTNQTSQMDHHVNIYD